jgi:hypothetical protein
MSLEQAIQDNTKAMQEFAAALRAQTELLTQVHSGSANKAEAASKVADKVVAETSKTAEKLQEQKPDEAGGDDEKNYTVDDAKQLTNKVVAAGKRDEMVALLKEFKVSVASKLPADQIAPFCKKAEALL